MEIKKKELVKFLSKIKMDGRVMITECLLVFGKDGLRITSTAQSGSARVSGVLFRDAFINYEAIGNVGLNDFDKVIKIIDNFSDTITIELDGNLLCIKEGVKKVEIEVVDEGYITKEKTDPVLQHDGKVKVAPAVMQGIIRDVKINKDFKLLFSTVSDMLLVTNTGKYKFTMNIPAQGIRDRIKVSVGQPFVDAIANLTDDYEMSIKTEYPILVEEVSENSQVRIIVAPMVQEDSGDDD